MKILNVIRDENYSTRLLIERDYLRISMVEPTRCTDVSDLFYFGMTLYVFRTVFPSMDGKTGTSVHLFGFTVEIILLLHYDA